MSDEVRVTNASGGAKGSKVYRFDQIPAGPMREVAARYGIGAMKYEKVNGVDNWINGYDFSLSMAALERHYNAFKAGDDIDDETYVGTDNESAYEEDGETPRPGTQHLAAVVWHCMFLMYHLENNPQFDDRPSTVLAKREPQPEPTPVEVLDRDGDRWYRARTGDSWYCTRATRCDEATAIARAEQNLLKPDTNIVRTLSDLRMTYGPVTIVREEIAA